MKILISESQYRSLIYEQTAFERQLDKQYSSPEGAKKTNQFYSNLWNMDPDDIVNLLSTGLEGIPGVGNLASFTIDQAHAISYAIRYFISDSLEDKIENAALAILTSVMAFLPVGGNIALFSIRRGLRQVVRDYMRKTPREVVNFLAELGIMKKPKIDLQKFDWRYNLLAVIIKYIKFQTLQELAVVISKKIGELIQKLNIKGVAKNALESLVSMINQLANISFI